MTYVSGVFQFPHELRGVAKKIQRVDFLINGLENASNELLKQRPVDIRGSFDQDPKKYVLKAYGDNSIPDMYAVLAGEIIHHLRSSLDYLVCSLAAKGGIPIHNNRNSYMPIKLDKESYNKSIGSGCLRGLSDSAVGFIEAAQPYHAEDPHTQAFYVLDYLDIFDKHRMLNVTLGAAKLDTEITIRGEGEIIGFGDPVIVQPTLSGTEIWSISLKMPSDTFSASATASVGIYIPLPDGRPMIEVISLLRDMRNNVARFVYNFFEEFDPNYHSADL